MKIHEDLGRQIRVFLVHYRELFISSSKLGEQVKNAQHVVFLSFTYSRIQRKHENNQEEINVAG